MSRRFLKWRGMTLIEGLILLAIFSIVTMTFYSGFILSTGHILNAKKRLTAIGLGTEKMEALRSLSYSDVAVVGGVPNGDVDPEETITMSGGAYRILTAISYVDDPDDGTLADATDAIPNDYKLAVIRVLWGNETAAETVTLRSLFVPSGLETSAGGGVLSINVIDGSGSPVSGASVRIQNSTVSPAVDTTLVTGANGNVSLVGAQASSQKYIVTVTKSGYESVTTLPPYPTTAYYPTDVHLTAVNDTFTTGIIVSSLLVDAELQFVDPLGESIPNVNFDLVGGRVIGVTTGFLPVYNFDASLVSDGSGAESLNDLNPGVYDFSLTESGYQLWKIDYGSDNNQSQLELDPGVSVSASVILLNETSPGYFVRALDDSDDSPIEGATVRLTNTGLSYSAEETTDRFGYAYFPRQSEDVLTNGVTYDVEVTHTGYQTETDSISINALTTGTIRVQPNP